MLPEDSDAFGVGLALHMVVLAEERLGYSLECWSRSGADVAAAAALPFLPTGRFG